MTIQKRRKTALNLQHAKRDKRAFSTMLDFTTLVKSVADAHNHFAMQAYRAVNILLTARNWLIGWYIEEYIRRGVDRAAYGERLMENLAVALQHQGISRCDRRELYRFHNFYITYPQIVETLSPQFSFLDNSVKQAVTRKVETPSPQSYISVGPDKLVSALSFSHLDELTDIDDVYKRSFYEAECIKGGWSVRELRRQIDSLYFERTGLSRDKKALSKVTHSRAEKAKIQNAIRDPYVFEFLGLQPKDVMEESDLETALLDKIEDFLLELGHGFCFEARQKRILIGDERYFVDLVFYHRLLKCHVLIDLKTDGFKHKYISQLNTYVNWYRKNQMASGDNPPVGMLLCTRKNTALVEYALGEMNNRLFVSRYQLELPKKEELIRFIREAV